MSNFITKIMAAIFGFNGSRRLRRVKIYTGGGGGSQQSKIMIYFQGTSD